MRTTTGFTAAAPTARAVGPSRHAVARPGSLALLQATAGNRAVASVVQRATVTQQMAGHPRLSRATGGSRPSATSELQADLNADGAAPPLAVDGIFGPLTDAALHAFQGRHGLAVD